MGFMCVVKNNMPYGAHDEDELEEDEEDANKEPGDAGSLEELQEEEDDHTVSGDF